MLRGIVRKSRDASSLVCEVLSECASGKLCAERTMVLEVCGKPSIVLGISQLLFADCHVFELEQIWLSMPQIVAPSSTHVISEDLLTEHSI